MKKEKIGLTAKCVEYNLIISTFYVIIASFILLMVFTYFSWSKTLAYYLILFFILISIIDNMYQFFKKKSYYISLGEDRLIITKGILFFSRTEIFYSKIYSLEKKQNFISKKFDSYQVSFRTIDMEFTISDISKYDRDRISNFVSERIS